MLGFPCDQFGHQEPGDEAEIKQFCSRNYDVTFPMFAKIEVNGANATRCSSALKKRAARPSRHPGDQVELHQVPRRPRGPRRAPLCADRHARDARGGHRGRARLNALAFPSPPRSLRCPPKPFLSTGASRGIGRACALLAAENGWSVGVNYREDAKAADAVVETIARGGGRAVALKGDVRSRPMRSECSTPRRRRLGP